MTPRILIVAGSDSGGGAGIQADIRTVAMLGGHPMTAIAAITAQNTLGVSAVHAVPADMVIAQIDAVADDIGIDAVKIGMIGSPETANAVADRLARMAGVPIVFDPVMIATSGSVLADAATIAAFGRLMAIATVTTPNLPELAALGGDAEAIVARTGRAVLVKGGHADGATIVDRLIAPDGETRFEGERIDTVHSHGTGCTLASAIAAGLGAGLPLPEAVARARLFVRIALKAAPGLGRGHGPMGHAAVRLDVAGDAPMLNQVTVAAADQVATAAFYEALGLTRIVDAPGRYARFESAGGATLSVEAGTAGGVYLECADPDAAAARMAAAGYAVEAAATDQRWGWREAWLCDPAGNRVCLYRAGENRRYPPWRLG
ncbi:bifunctional hydroxymethylpyrimidine kinase/phosphomethylpyrimidine kinase [Sphingomonas flavalba]|uniref:bifunctional hydroxymethylpyrimidine kinase/phosphomethylpyrimidine kinase n=1 Tax=Sphingomonas flavalba TaxID=2559804 RepID=UPI0039E178E5